jgi:4-amino-4-deoxy-L-arabinose transferase-like glycosyltransferase
MSRSALIGIDVRLDYNQPMTRRHGLGLMLLCLLVATALRLPLLADVPPGPHHDEAAYGLAAGDIGLRGERPIFITSYTGREVLFPYLAAVLARSGGNSLFSLRLTAALIGVLTVAATYWLASELGQDRRLALLAAVLVAVSFWHLLFSRLGFRAVSQPLLQAITLAALLRGLRRNERPWLVAAGAGLGLTGYTYLAARLFPIPLALAALPLLLGGKASRRRRQLGLVSAVALLVLSPLLLYFWQHPESFWVRIDQVSAGQQMGLLESYGRALGIFFVSGDPYWRFNLPGRPLFNGFGAIFLLVGWLYCLRAALREENDWRRFGYLFLFLVPLFMILPTALAAGEIVPSNLRAIGLLPFLYLLPALGLGLLLRLLDSLRSRQAGTILALLILSVGGLSTSHLYFQEWATRADLFYESDADLAAVARYLDELDEAGELEGKTIYVAALHYRHPTLAFLSRHYDRVNWLPGSQAFVLPQSGGALYFYPRSSPAPAWVQTWLESATRLSAPNGPDGEPVFMAFEFAAAAAPFAPAPGVATAVNFGHAIELAGYDVADGQAPAVILYWRVHGRPEPAYSTFLHLEDSWRYRWAQQETAAYPSEQWQAGDLIVQRVDIPVRAGAPPGQYRLRLGWFNPETGHRLPHLDLHGRYAGDSFVVDEIPVLAAGLPAAMPVPPHPLDEPVLPGLQLLGYERAGTTVATGEAYWLALWWQATAPLPHLATRLEMARTGEAPFILSESQPVHGSFPFKQWPTPLFLIDHRSAPVPAFIAAGDYRLYLRLLDEAEQTVALTDLGPLTVTETERLFEVPPLAVYQESLFGDEVRLLGYDLVARETGDFSLSLAWQATRQPAADYTVFVHVLDEPGFCCLWQQDIMPRQGSYPTSRWLPAEVVVDDYLIELPPDTPAGSYRLEIGLYLAESGQRLLITAGEAAGSDALYLDSLLRAE